RVIEATGSPRCIVVPRFSDPASPRDVAAPVGALRISCFFHAPATPVIYTLSLHDALPISDPTCPGRWRGRPKARCRPDAVLTQARSGAALAGELLDLVHDPLVHDAATHALGQARADVLDVDRGADPHGPRPALRQEAGEHVPG